MEGHPRLVDMILSNAHDKASLFRQRDIHGDSALHLAAFSSSPYTAEIIKKLLDSGFPLDLTNSVSLTTWQIA